MLRCAQDSQRWVVRTTAGERVSLRPKNLVVVHRPAAPPAASSSRSQAGKKGKRKNQRKKKKKKKKRTQGNNNNPEPFAEGDLATYRAAPGAQVESVKILKLHPGPPAPTEFWTTRIVESYDEARLGLEPQVAADSDKLTPFGAEAMLAEGGAKGKDGADEDAWLEALARETQLLKAHGKKSRTNKTKQRNLESKEADKAKIREDLKAKIREKKQSRRAKKGANKARQEEGGEGEEEQQQQQQQQAGGGAAVSAFDSGQSDSDDSDSDGMPDLE